jgi:hypothetical protein
MKIFSHKELQDSTHKTHFSCIILDPGEVLSEIERAIGDFLLKIVHTKA